MKNSILTIFLLFNALAFFQSCQAQVSQTTPKENAVSEFQKTSKFLNRLDSVQLIDDLKILSADAMQGRETGTPGGDMAKNFLVKRYKEIGLEAFDESFEQVFDFKIRLKNMTGKNVVGFLKGSKHPEKYIVLTAHYDHLGVDGEKIFNGADDNASGVSALLASATFFKKNPPEHSIIFVAIDAEEKGLRGAYAFVENCPVRLENLMLNVNLDMISRNEKNEIYFCGTHHYPILKEKLTPLQAKSPLHLKFGHDTPDLGYNDWTNSSDHAPFHKKQIPFIYLGVEDHADYHQHTDDFEKVDLQFFFYSANLVIEMLLAFDKN